MTPLDKLMTAIAIGAYEGGLTKEQRELVEQILGGKTWRAGQVSPVTYLTVVLAVKDSPDDLNWEQYTEQAKFILSYQRKN